MKYIHRNGKIKSCALSSLHEQIIVS